MSNNQDQNLLSFLKNQSLFNQSPNRRMSSRSRDRKSERNRISPNPNQQTNYAYNSSINPNAQYQDNRVNGQIQNSTSYANGYSNGGMTNSQLQGGVQGNVQTNNYTVQSNIQGGQQGQGLFQGNGGQYNATTTTTYQGNNNNTANQLFSGMDNTTKELTSVAGNLVTYSSSFESARVESAQRLDGLANKVRTAIHNLNYKL